MSDPARSHDPALPPGQGKPSEDLLPLVYDELRKLAAHKMALEAPGQTLQATALVHEAWLRLSGAEAQHWQGRRHFFFAAARAMRRILVEKARRKQRLKHGGQLERVHLDPVELTNPMPDEQLLALDAALGRLAEMDPRANVQDDPRESNRESPVEKTTSTPCWDKAAAVGPGPGVGGFGPGDT